MNNIIKITLNRDSVIFLSNESKHTLSTHFFLNRIFSRWFSLKWELFTYRLMKQTPAFSYLETTIIYIFIKLNIIYSVLFWNNNRLRIRFQLNKQYPIKFRWKELYRLMASNAGKFNIGFSEDKKKKALFVMQSFWKIITD